MRPQLWQNEGMTKILDASNRELAVGDIVVYCVTSGRSPVLKYGKVVSLDKFAVQGLDTHWAKNEVELQSRLSYLQYPNDRVLKLDEAQVTPLIRFALAHLEEAVEIVKKTRGNFRDARFLVCDDGSMVFRTRHYEHPDWWKRDDERITTTYTFSGKA